MTFRGSNRIAAISAARLVSLRYCRGDVTLSGSNKAIAVPAAQHGPTLGEGDVTVWKASRMVAVAITAQLASPALGVGDVIVRRVSQVLAQLASPTSGEGRVFVRRVSRVIATAQPVSSTMGERDVTVRDANRASAAQLASPALGDIWALQLPGKVNLSNFLSNS